MKPDIQLPEPELCREKFRKTFKNISTSDLELLFKGDSIKFYKKGSIIYLEGANMKGCYFIYSGIVKIYQTGNEGKEQIIKFEKEGDIFGFRSVILKEKACTSVETLTDSVVCFIPDSVLSNLIQQNPEFAYELMQIACKELGESNKYIKNIAQKPVRKRLAEILLMLAQDFGMEKDGQLKISISREDLGNFAGTATETIIRLLSDFKAGGLVDSKGRKIILLNLNKLKQVAELI
ncbi:MAG: Crp/Fnr family transcriptional regulator [Odoribacter sp.]|nr:Crp/Fnr family transcriptional regulator [Odoribacter sp.]